MFAKESPFDVGLRCNVSIEVNVAMRLGELILASRTDDKQLVALGHKLASSMKYLVDNLDDRQWDSLSEYIDDQSDDDDHSFKPVPHQNVNRNYNDTHQNLNRNYNENNYISKAQKTVNEIPEYSHNSHNEYRKNRRPNLEKREVIETSNEFASIINPPKTKDQINSEVKEQRDWGGWSYKENN